jgi:hypothetical protein
MHGPDQVLVHASHYCRRGDGKMLLPLGKITVERDQKE